MIEAKIEGHEIATAPAEPEREVINLMEALKRSVAEAQTNRALPAKPKKPLAKGRTAATRAGKKKRA